MNKDEKFSEEFINAFVDDELTPDEKAQAYARLGDDETLNRQVCELRKVRDLVGLAYRNVPVPVRGISAIAANRKCSTAVAAGLALIVGGLGGWFLRPAAEAPPGVAVAQAVPGAEEAVNKVLFHVSEGNADHLKAVLDEVETLIKFYRQNREKARVEVVTNGGGLSLLMAGISPYAERIQRMQKEYGELTFVACQNTIDRVQQELGLTTKLLPGVVVIDSGVAQILRRQSQGWAYLQV